MLIMEVSLRFECNVMLNIYVMLLWPGITGIRTINIQATLNPNDCITIYMGHRGSYYVYS